MAKILEQRDYYKEKFLELREELEYVTCPQSHGGVKLIVTFFVATLRKHRWYHQERNMSALQCSDCEPPGIDSYNYYICNFLSVAFRPYFGSQKEK